MHPLVEIAKKAVEEYVRNAVQIEPPEGLADEMKLRAGAFVSLKVKGVLRGCIGTISPLRENICAEVIQNAISSATEDPRFAPVGIHELDGLQYSVDVLQKPEPAGDESELDPQAFGVIVSSKGRRGLLLPALEGVDTVARQLEIARAKAGIGPEEKEVQIERFEVKRYK